jgi:hypothetical protein
MSRDCGHFKVRKPVRKTRQKEKEMGAAMSVDHWSAERFAKIQEYLEMAIKWNRLPIVSVGSGTGQYEVELRSKLAEPREMICVDKYIMPPSLRNFATVEELICARSELVGNCILLLMWPNDEGHHRELSETDTPYDVDAIEQLNPRHIITLYEEFGGAGSLQFHDWLVKSKCLSNLVVRNMEKGRREKCSLPAYETIDYDVWRYGEPSFLHLNEKSIVVAYLMRE